MILAPMTFIVTLVLILAVVIGVLILIRALGPGDQNRRNREDRELGTQTPCPKCKFLNPTHARYCGHCGEALS